MSSGWESLPGYPPGVEQKIRSGALDEPNRRGSRTRFIWFAVGVHTKHKIFHEYREEVFLFTGDLTVGNDPEAICEPSRRVAVDQGSPANSMTVEGA